MRDEVKITLPLPALKSKIGLFYILAFLPLVLIFYYFYVTGFSVLGSLILFYGFLLLFMKKDRLFPSSDPVRLQRSLGLVAMFASFLVFYAMIGFESSVRYEAGTAFYTIYVLGLLLVFFNPSTLKETVSAVFLISVGGSSYYLGEWLEYYLTPLVPYFVVMFMFVLMILNIPATLRSSTTVVLNTSRGPEPVSFEAGCIGIFSFLIFSVVVAVTMLEVSATRRTKLLWSVGGVAGTFFVNLVRVSLIAVVIYYFGYANWGIIHSYIGYTLFLLWLIFFFVSFTRREAFRNKIMTLGQKLRCALY
jgi:exosortase/archaeosortase family protein